jgi:transposase-like protein
MLTSLKETTTLEGLLKAISENGFDAVLPVIEVLINEAAKLQRAKALKAAPYERTEERQGHANGFKDKTVHTRMGPLKVKIPQVRGLDFYPGCIEKGIRSERALKLAIAEMYVQGVATRKVQKITEELCGFHVSSTQVSNLVRELDEGLKAFRERPLGCFKYVYFDAIYEKVREHGLVQKKSVLIAIGVNEEGHREILSISVSSSEAEVHWRTFFENLCKRGLKGVKLIISDDHKGLKNALAAIFSNIPWQRCYFHLAQNAQNYVPQKAMQEEIADAVREVFSETSLEDAQQRLKRVVPRFEDKAPKFAEWFEENAPEAFTYLDFPKEHWKKIRTNNNAERLNREIRRRTRVVSIFPNEDSCLRLITAVLQEIHEQWTTGKVYIKM